MDADYCETLDSYSTEAKANMQGRGKRINRLVKHIAKNGVDLPKKKLIAIFSLRENVSPSTIYDYIAVLRDGDIVIQRGDHILLVENATDDE